MAASRGKIAADDDRTAGQRGEPAAGDPADEAGHQRRTGEARQHHGRSKEPRLAPEERDRDTVASEVTIHQQRDESVLRERPADLQRRVERLPHFQGLDAEQIANPLPDPVHLRIGLSHRDDGERQTQETGHHDRAGFPIPVVAGDQNDASSRGVKCLQRRHPLRRQSRTSLAPGRRRPTRPSENRSRRGCSCDRRRARAAAADPRARRQTPPGGCRRARRCCLASAARRSRRRHVRCRSRATSAGSARHGRSRQRCAPLLSPCTVQRRGTGAVRPRSVVRVAPESGSTPRENRSSWCRAPASACCAGRCTRQ